MVAMQATGSQPVPEVVVFSNEFASRRERLRGPWATSTRQARRGQVQGQKSGRGLISEREAPNRVAAAASRLTYRSVAPLPAARRPGEDDRQRAGRVCRIQDDLANGVLARADVHGQLLRIGQARVGGPGRVVLTGAVRGEHLEVVLAQGERLSLIHI